MSRPLRAKAIREGRLIPSSVPCLLVKVDGVWVEQARLVNEDDAPPLSKAWFRKATLRRGDDVVRAG